MPAKAEEALPPPVSTPPPLNPTTQSTYAAMVDPDHGCTLRFFSTTQINGTKIAKLEPEDVNPEIEYWKTSVLCAPWNPELDVHTETIVSLPIWVKFPRLELKYWGLDCLSKLGSVLGVPMKIDQRTKDKTYLQYPHLLIDIHLNKEFPDYIEFLNDQGVFIRQAVTYEWRPTKCDHCLMYGHLSDQCRKKKTRQEWRPKQSSAISAPPAPLRDVRRRPA
ncbi:hypothetical protein Cgig2_032926 [Carnegiea gigantea]|uniref:DUF4283 domain-containing protein n=1 Tax=Carnegiea gigantea TaxID=171969 RepID=A0A9Q1GS61_9CARY|nr:hypothetical protein Cgig2_032926 [Carnegiea gigantea]